MTETALSVITELLDVESGEVLPASVENAAVVLASARVIKQKIDTVIRSATDYLASESTHQGIKTFNVGSGTVSLSGGASIEYDAADLMEALRVAGCPEDRIEAAVVAEITYKVNRSVLRQLAGANPDYKAAIDLAERTIEKPWRVSVR
jgi:hypothetical protein